MSTRKHGFKSTSLNLLECRLPDLELLVASDIQLYDVTNWLDGCDPLLFIFPCLHFGFKVYFLLSYEALFLFELLCLCIQLFLLLKQAVFFGLDFSHPRLLVLGDCLQVVGLFNEVVFGFFENLYFLG